MKDQKNSALGSEPGRLTEASHKGWQRIETAPKDGTKVLLCRVLDADGRPMGDAFGIFCQVAAWWGEEDRWVVYCDLIQDPSLHFEPTHWQPLPEPPEGA